MKNYFKESGLYIFLSFIIIISLFLFVNISKAENKLEDRLAGRILLQVEENGESWYVTPKTKERIFLGRPSDAFAIMREEGVGISNDNLNKIPIGTWHNVTVDSDDDMLSDAFEDAIGTNKYKRDSDGDGSDDYTEITTNNNPVGDGNLKIDKDYATTHSGKIFLAVERKGEAWYIDPFDNKRYFLGRPDDAFSLMRKKGLGISNKNLEQIKKKLQNKKIKINENWNKYINYDLGFEINYPRENLGKEVEIIEDGNLVYITTGDSYQKAKIEAKKNASIYEKARGIAYGILIENVLNEAELEEFIQKRYGANCLLGGITKIGESEVYKVGIDTDTNRSAVDPEGCFINYYTVIRYDKAKNKVAAWDIGQGVQFMVNEEPVDNQIKESFRFLK